MDLKKLNPWNWFKHEEQQHGNAGTLPVKREEYPQVKYPMTNILQFHREIDRLFDDAFHGFSFPSLSRSPLWNQWNQMMTDDFMPAIRANLNIESDNNQYTITLETPGLEQKDLSIELKDRVLVIKGNKQQEQEDKDKHYYRIERQYGSFERVLAVPEDAIIDEIKAGMENGLLTVTIPRQEVTESNVKKIAINE